MGVRLDHGALLVRAQPVLQVGPVALDGLLHLVVRADEYEGVASASNFGKVFSLAHCSTVTAILPDTAWISSMATSPGLNIWLKMFKMKIKTTTKATILDEKQ